MHNKEEKMQLILHYKHHRRVSALGESKWYKSNKHPQKIRTTIPESYFFSSSFNCFFLSPRLICFYILLSAKKWIECGSELKKKNQKHKWQFYLHLARPRPRPLPLPRPIPLDVLVAEVRYNLAGLGHWLLSSVLLISSSRTISGTCSASFCSIGRSLFKWEGWSFRGKGFTTGRGLKLYVWSSEGDDWLLDDSFVTISNRNLILMNQMKC